MKDKIQNMFTETITILNENQNSDFKVESMIIDNSYFDCKYRKESNITECDKHLNVFNDLKKIRKPVLYWFEFDYTKERNLNIRSKYVDYRNSIKWDYKNSKYRNTSAFKSYHSLETKTLYVGKVESGFWGRIVTHLGYNSNPRTAGMQLDYWYRENLSEFGNLNLNYIVFEPQMKHLISLLEKKLALDLKPLIGKY